MCEIHRIDLFEAAVVIKLLRKHLCHSMWCPGQCTLQVPLPEAFSIIGLYAAPWLNLAVTWDAVSTPEKYTSYIAAMTKRDKICSAIPCLVCSWQPSAFPHLYMYPAQLCQRCTISCWVCTLFNSSQRGKEEKWKISTNPTIANFLKQSARNFASLVFIPAK